MFWRVSRTAAKHGRRKDIIWPGIFLLHALAYLAVIPPWQAPDEPTSFELLLTMEARGRLVTPADADPAIQRAIIASMERNRFWELGGYGGRPLTDADRDFRTIWSCCYTQLSRPPLYQLLLLPVAKLTAGRPLDERLRWLRLMTVLLGAVTIAVIARIGGELIGLQPALCWLLPALAALSPQFAYTSATFNSDNLATLLGSLICWLLLRVLRGGITARALSGLALLVGLGIGTRRTTLLLVPAVLLALGWQATVMWRGRDKQARRRLLFVLGGSLATLGLVMAMLSTVRATARRIVLLYVFKNALPYQLSVFRQLAQPQLNIWSWLYGNVVFLNLSFWGSYGWHAVHIAPALGYLLLAVTGASWLCAVGWLLWRARALAPRWAVRFGWVCVCAVIVTLGLTLIGTQPANYPQGRYLFPALVPLFLLMAIGLCGWWPRRWARWGASLLLAALVTLDLYALLGVVLPAYLP